MISPYVNDYSVLLIDPHVIEDFDKFNTPLGDVLEFIKRQNDKSFLKNMSREKGPNWKMDLDTVKAINTFSGANIPINEVKEGMVDMCKATQALIDEGREIGEREGVKKGIQQGIKQGVIQGEKLGTDLVNELNRILIESDRIEDLKRATKDPKYQRQLIEELLPKKKQ